MILIGSCAINERLTQDIRKPSDIDLVGDYDQAMSYRKHNSIKTCYPINSGASIFMQDSRKFIHEIEVAWPNSRAEKFCEFVFEQDDNIKTNDGLIIPSLDVLYLLKMSHRYLKDSPHFKKTLDDILFLRKMGAKIRPEHQEFYEQRMKDTYVNKLPKLNQGNGDFFGADTGVVYKYDHDTIHEAVKHLEHPAYTYFQDGEVWCSKKLWDEQSEEVKLFAAYEEITVLALERSLIPFPNKKTPKEAFNMAQMKLSTSISSGWFREYCWESYYKIQAMYSDAFVSKFEQGIINGVVNPHKENA